MNDLFKIIGKGTFFLFVVIAIFVIVFGWSRRITTYNPYEPESMRKIRAELDHAERTAKFDLQNAPK